MLKRINDKDDISTFLAEKQTLEDTIWLLKKYRLSFNDEQYDDYIKALSFLIDFECDFILGE